MASLKRRLIAAMWVVLLLITALTAASYGWMTIATSYKVSDIDLFVITDNAIEIAPDVDGAPGKWSTLLFSEELIAPDAFLRPVTWSAEDATFYAPSYGFDGRIDFLSPVKIANLHADNQSPSVNEAEEREGAGYLITVELWFRTGSNDTTVHLTLPKRNSEGEQGAGTYVVGTPEWSTVNGCNVSGGKGAENVIRFGFMTYDETYDNGGFYIYEPNVTDGSAPTVSIGGSSYEGDGKLIRQYPTTWTEKDPMLRGEVDYNVGQFYGAEDDASATSLFKLEADTPRRVTLYIWLEGQDEQCLNSISAGKILANLQFGATGTSNGDIVRPEDIPSGNKSTQGGNGQ